MYLFTTKPKVGSDLCRLLEMLNITRNYFLLQILALFDIAFVYPGVRSSCLELTTPIKQNC